MTSSLHDWSWFTVPAGLAEARSGGPAHQKASSVSGSGFLGVAAWACSGGSACVGRRSAPDLRPVSSKRIGRWDDSPRRDAPAHRRSPTWVRPIWPLVDDTAISRACGVEPLLSRLLSWGCRQAQYSRAHWHLPSCAGFPPAPPPARAHRPGRRRSRSHPRPPRGRAARLRSGRGSGRRRSRPPRARRRCRGRRARPG